MHSSASRAMDGINSVRRACAEPNARFMSEDKNELNASAARSGTVSMILPNAFSAVPIESHTPRSSRGDCRWPERHTIQNRSSRIDAADSGAQLPENVGPFHFPRVAAVLNIGSAIIERGIIPVLLETVSAKDGEDLGVGLCLEVHDRFSFILK